MKIYGLKNCDTCRKALKALVQAELVDVRSDGVAADAIREGVRSIWRRIVEHALNHLAWIVGR